MAYNPHTPEEIREEIIAVAKDEFLSKGIANTQMKDIASKVKIGRATLYRYYSQKEQLAFEVTNHIISNISNDTIEYGLSHGTNGFEKLCLVAFRFLELLKQNKSVLSYLSEFDRVFQMPYPAFDESKSFSDSIRHSITLLSKIFDEGKKDGTIKSDVESSLLASVFINQILGVSQRVLPRSKSIEDEQGYTGEEIIRKSIEIFLGTLKK